MEIKNIEIEHRLNDTYDIYVSFNSTAQEVHIIATAEDPSDLEICEDSPYLESDYERFVLDCVTYEFAKWIEDEKIQRQHDLYDLYNDK